MRTEPRNLRKRLCFRRRVRHHDLSRSVWICSRNDAIGNLAVLAATAGVFGTATGWPDLIVAAMMASLSISGGWQIVRQARGELTSQRMNAESWSAAE